MEKRKKAALHSLGCKVNSYETKVMEEDLIKNGYEIVGFDERADVYIINTCTVTAIADKKSRQMIRRARHNNEDAIVVACGCFGEKTNINDIPECDIVIGNNLKSTITKEIDNFKKTKQKSKNFTDLFIKDIEFESMSLSSSFERTRAFIKVQDGCNAYCTYCLIPYVRGLSRSRNYKEIINEAKKLSENGHKEIVLCAINLSDYKDNDKTLSDLIYELSEIDSIKRIRLGSLEPYVFTKEFVSVLEKSKKVCPHFHLSLQSMCDSTLKSMKRRYTVSEAFNAVENITEIFTKPAICADVIAGFPGESKDNFDECYKNINKLPIYELHVFPYSEREGTIAAKMDGKLSKNEKTKRAKQLIELSLQKSKQYKEAYINSKVEVLFEEKETIEGRDFWLGFSKEYIKCALEYDGDLKGEIKEVEVKSVLNNELMEVSLLY